MKVRKSSRYRLFCPERGVIGPPFKDSDKILRVNLSSKVKEIVWESAGVQKVDCSGLQVQEFKGHSLNWRSLVDYEWNKLKTQTHLTCSNNPKFILMSGLPGSGKTTLAKNISLMTGWLHYDFARFAHEIIGVLPLTMDDYQNIGIFAEKKINDVLRNGISVIYDTTSPSTSIRQHLFESLESTYKKYVVYLSTPVNICLERVTQRYPASPIDCRPEVHRYTARHVRTFWDYVNDYEVPKKCLVVKNEDNIFEILEQLEWTES